jgi:hypothetical protein
MNEKPKDEELAALWIKSGPKGEYMTGKIGDVPVVAFRNTRKKNEKEPDWRILRSRPKSDAPQRDDAPPVMDDSIPF